MATLRNCHPLTLNTAVFIRDYREAISLLALNGPHSFLVQIAHMFQGAICHPPYYFHTSDDVDFDFQMSAIYSSF